MVNPIAKIRRLLSPPPNVFSAMPPTSVAPRVFAIVLRLKIAELVSSSSFLNLSSKLPRVGEEIFKSSISAEVMLKIIASKAEQSAEIPMVNETATTKSQTIA